ncbi:MAG: hypothetical protein ACWA5W_11510 [Phycisphaerales bacterium]
MDINTMYSTRPQRSILMLAALALAAGWPNALAHTEPSVRDTQEPGSPEQVAMARSVLPRVGTNQTVIMPTMPKVSVALQPGITEGEDWLKILHETLGEHIAPSTLAEGAFVLDRPGQLIRGPKDLLIFVPDADTRAPGEGPVLLMPCRTLEQLESQWIGQSVVLSGEIFTYHDRNQLLISKYQIISNARPLDHAGQAANTPSDPDAMDDADSADHSEPAESVEDDPDVRDLLDELSADIDPLGTSSRRAVTTSETAAPQSTGSQPTAPRPQLTASADQRLPEGTLILRQPARMVRNSDGAWSLVFDHDAANSKDAIALIVEPCRMLMRMERLAMDTGDAGQLLISGRVYTYKEAHYILPNLVQRVRSSELNSLQ